jgi:hypothetical protein
MMKKKPRKRRSPTESEEQDQEECINLCKMGSKMNFWEKELTLLTPAHPLSPEIAITKKIHDGMGA